MALELGGWVAFPACPCGLLLLQTHFQLHTATVWLQGKLQDTLVSFFLLNWVKGHHQEVSSPHLNLPPAPSLPGLRRSKLHFSIPIPLSLPLGNKDSQKFLGC